MAKRRRGGAKRSQRAAENRLQDLEFPDHVYEHIQEYYEKKAGA